MARPVVLTPPIHSSSTLHRFRRQELKDGIAQFYDESSQIWEEIWGEHMHHGYYYTGKEKDHQKAQVCAVIGWFVCLAFPAEVCFLFRSGAFIDDR